MKLPYTDSESARPAMDPEERIRELCELADEEQDPDKLVDLALAIFVLLRDFERRLCRVRGIQ
jgi:hypothetical protein